MVRQQLQVQKVGTGNIGTTTNTGKASGNTGSTTLTVKQIPSHQHEIDIGSFANGGEDWNSIKNGHIAPQNNQGTRYKTRATGGGEGHTHTLNNHQHTIPYIECYVWKRTA